MKRIFIIVAMLLASLFIAQNATAQQDFPKDLPVSWINPSTYTDDTPIEAGDLESIRIEVFRQNDLVPIYTITIPDNGEGAAQSITLISVIPRPGNYRKEAYAIVVGGVESDAAVSDYEKYTGKPRRITFVTVN